MTEPLILTVDALLAAHAAAVTTCDNEKARSLVSQGTIWALDADLDAEFAHDGIYWDAADEAEIAAADAVAKRAKDDLERLLTCPPIKAAYEADLQGQHYQAMRAERVREPALSDEDA